MLERQARGCALAVFIMIRYLPTFGLHKVVAIKNSFKHSYETDLSNVSVAFVCTMHKLNVMLFLVMDVLLTFQTSLIYGSISLI